MEEGNKIILSLLKKYEHVLEMEGGNPGKSIEEAYDLVTVKPVPQWTALYEEVKAELREAGINF